MAGNKILKHDEYVSQDKQTTKKVCSINFIDFHSTIKPIIFFSHVKVKRMTKRKYSRSRSYIDNNNSLHVIIIKVEPKLDILLL